MQGHGLKDLAMPNVIVKCLVKYKRSNSPNLKIIEDDHYIDAGEQSLKALKKVVPKPL